MNLAILASVLIFALVVTIGVKRSDNEMENANNDFWEKEYKSNFVRKKSLDDLNYITIPSSFLEFDYDLENDRVNDAFESIKNLSECKIVNFSGITNTDLKLQYGTANITVLSEYDYNYTCMVRSLQTLAESLYNRANDASTNTDPSQDINYSNSIAILEFAVDTGTDMSSTYKLLGDIYFNMQSVNKLNELLNKSHSLNGLMKSSIEEYLEAHLDKLHNLPNQNN